MKGKRVGKKDANTKTTQRHVIKEETRSPWRKTSPLPSKLNLPDVPKPSKLLFQQGYSELCLV